MPKGYIVADFRARDRAEMQRFAEALAPVIAAFGGRVVARDAVADIDLRIVEGS